MWAGNAKAGSRQEPASKKYGTKQAYSQRRSIACNEDRFCRCGEPFLYRLGQCLSGHALPEQVLVRREGSPAAWIPLDQIASAK
jgi:hypothetical protein